LALLAAASSSTVAAVAADLELAEADGLIAADAATGEYRFSHGIVAEVVAGAR
jgi:hypothetical protein